jgi:NAD-dependent deacetylase
MKRPIRNIVILTGAGISAESGIPTFRASDGLWCGHRVEEVATPEGFAANPALVQDFYNQRRRQLKDATPNAAHLALARLSAEWGGNILLVTQNVDDLHDRAHRNIIPKGNFALIHMHGELLKARHIETGQIIESKGDLDSEGKFRPHIVWFGEMPFRMVEIRTALSSCDMFISIGTSGSVYPAAGFALEARQSGAWTVELNLEPSSGVAYFHETHFALATQCVTKYVQRLLDGVLA